MRTARNGGIRGYNAGKKIKGRKWHILLDMLGLVLASVVHSAAVQVRDGARLVLEKLEGKHGWIRRVWMDGSYRGKLGNWVSSIRRLRWIDLEIVRR